MKIAHLLAAGVIALAMPAMADDKPSPREVEQIVAALAAAGFTGGEMEKDSDGAVAYEVDDAIGRDGTKFDIKLDKDFRILKVERD